VERLHGRDGDRRLDSHLLMTFTCTLDPRPADAASDVEEAPGEEHWILEVEEYIRHFALRTAHKVLLFFAENDELVGVSAFVRQEVALSGKRRLAAWRLEVIALDPAWHAST
jgi:hypothetical protein